MKSVFLALCVSALSLTVAERARAQACCASAGTLAPGRLLAHERVLVGAGLSETASLGSYDSSGSFIAMPDGAVESISELTLIVGARPVPRVETTLVVPVVMTYRRTSRDHATGSGAGDVRLGGRWLVLRPSDVPQSVSWLPDLGLLVTLTLPTGRAPEDATSVLAVDATGLGTTQAFIGLSVEKKIADATWELLAGSTVHAARRVGEVRHLAGPELTLGLHGSYPIAPRWTLGGGLNWGEQWNAEINGHEAPGSARRKISVDVGASLEWTSGYRSQLALALAPPVGQFGRNQTSSVALSVAVLSGVF